MARGLERRCDSCPLRRAGLFSRLSVHLRRKLDAEKTFHVLPAGHALFEEGAPALAVHCIWSGLVKVSRLEAGGQEQILRILGPGEVVGYRAVLAGEPYSAAAQTLEETSLCTIPSQALLAMIRASSDFALEILAKVARELRVTEAALTRRSVRRRLASALLALAGARDSGGHARALRAVRLRRTDLARLVATSPESLSRALHRLENERSIERSREEIRLHDPAMLERLAGDDPLGDLISIK